MEKNYRDEINMEKNYRDESLDEKILKVLEGNNFSRNKLGTYFYKDVIKKIVISLKACDTEEAKLKLQRDAINPYSELYEDLVRRFFNVEVVSDDLKNDFHRLIKDACFDTKITKGKYGNVNNYLIMAYHFGRYMLNSFNRQEIELLEDEEFNKNEGIVLSGNKVKARILSKPDQK